MRVTSSCIIYTLLGVRFAGAATSYLLPLYFWPSDDGSCWSEVASVAAAHPDLDWIIILNPDSGPSTLDQIQPILDCTVQLRAVIPSVKLLGYVSTEYGKRAIPDVVADINTYSTWSSAEAQFDGKTTKITPLDGIFLDEMPNEDTDNLARLYLAYARYVRTQLGSDSAFVVMNPGTKSDAAYYEAADLIVSYETDYAGWSSSSISTSSETPYSKQAIMIHSLPQGDTHIVSDLLDSLVTQDKVGAVWLSDLDLDEEDIYASLSDDFSNVVSGVDERNLAASSAQRRGRRNVNLIIPRASYGR